MIKPNFAFFGTPEFATIILDELELKGFLPNVVVTAPDAPKGRKLVVTKSEVRIWAEKRNIPVLTPTTLRDGKFGEHILPFDCTLFIVAAYGKIIPKEVLDIPQHGTLNVHPSLLPKFRGASPIESAILSDEPHTGVSIMVLDEEMDHGPVLAQRERITRDWPPKGSVLTRDLAHFGGVLLAEIIPEWMNGLTPHAQDHARATFTKKIHKEDGRIDLTLDPYTNYKKIRSYDEWPGTFFFVLHAGKNVRVRIIDATYADGKLAITRVVPEGKKEMSYEDFLRGYQ